MKLYRAISDAEKLDFDNCGVLRTTGNTLQYNPSYKYFLIIDIHANKFNKIPHADMVLDGYDAVSIHEDHLPAVNKCIVFVTQSIL